MKNIYKKITLIALLSISLFALTSCEDNGYKEFSQFNAPTQALNGEWFIDITNQNTGDLEVEHALHKTFDSNDGKMYIDDSKLGWWLKGKLNVNTTDMTFNIANEPNLLDPGTTFTITEGKIIKNGGVSKDGNIVDSIYFKAEFSYAPGVIYVHSGHKRTGFLEDEY